MLRTDDLYDLFPVHDLDLPEQMYSWSFMMLALMFPVREPHMSALCRARIPGVGSVTGQILHNTS